MTLPIWPRHLKRYAEFARLLAWHWNRGWGASDEPNLDEPDESQKERSLAADLEAMGPSFIKVGQMLAARPDLTPERIRVDLKRLRDDVEPSPVDEVREAIEDELGVSVSKAFDSFEPTPLATASLAQVHAAVLRDGTEVVVKVLRPGVEKVVRGDMDILADIADWIEDNSQAEARFGLATTIREMREAVLRELDYRLEARNMRRISEHLSSYEHLFVPEVIPDFSSRRVLTMARVRGVSVGDISPLRQMESDTSDVARELFRAYLDQALIHGLVHADPHPGNVILADDGRLALVDMGMVTTVSSDLRHRVLRLILAVAEQDGSSAAREAEAMGTRLEGYDANAFRSAVAREVALQDPSEDGAELGATLVKLTGLAAETGLRPLPALGLLGKTLLNLEETGRLLNPGFRPAEEVRRYAPELLLRLGVQDADPMTLVRKSLALKELVATLPGRAERILDKVEEGDFRIRFDLVGEDRLVRAVMSIANRITEGILLAALIVGAALMFRVETSFQLLGYPGIAMILFAFATIGGVRVLWTILRDPDR